MSSDAIFLRAGSELVVMSETPYEKEAILQQALAEYPEVIAGPTTSGGASGGLLLVRQEMGVPDSADGSARWSLDHLFIDRESVPVIVEVKRSTDTRIRREVVGQLLDYAANGTKYWPVSTLRQFASDTEAEGNAGEDPVSKLWPEVDVEEFWRKVQVNLDAGRVRLLIVSDRMPPELARIIEFLNEQMNPAEVLGVELRQYLGGSHTAYVPNVIGQTARAQDVKAVPGGGQSWTRETLLEVAHARRTEAEVALVQRLLDHVQTRGKRPGWGRSVTAGVSGWYEVAGEPGPVWNLNVGGEALGGKATFYFYFSGLVDRAAGRIKEAADLLALIPAMKPKIHDAKTLGWKNRPTVNMQELVADPHYVDLLFQAIEILADEPDPKDPLSSSTPTTSGA